MSRRRFLACPLALPFAGLAGQPTAVADPTTGSGLVDTALEAAETWISVGDRTAWLYGYNGRVPGPLIEARPGDVVRIQFKNSLLEDTNLHFHGLHIPPSGSADNSFLMIPGGESFRYEFSVPTDHPGGTFWIHPHVHESAARQVSRGLVAPLVIRGELDAIPEIQSAPEFFLILQDFDLNAGGIPKEPSLLERTVGREGNLITVSGRVQPVIPIGKDGWVRLRLINASSSRFYRLRLEEHTLYQIASDGGALPVPRALDELMLTPGERAEVMVQGSRPPGAYRLLNLPYNRGSMGMTRRCSERGSFVVPRAGGRGTTRGVGQSGCAEDPTLATLSYDRQAGQPVRLPERLVSIQSLSAPARVRRFVLGQGMGMMGGGTGFSINGRTFDPARTDTLVRLGEVEDWEFVNAMMMDHPMHIHTNPVQVVNRDGSAEQAWRDVVLVRARSRVRVRMRFLDYTGRLMYHCHILDHEDLGMMGVLEIADAR